ncbi:MAG: hypothetical protein IJX27_03460 [Clostridia bacterium]|nr:hypothetical protein [Clostridia bacterium]
MDSIDKYILEYTEDFEFDFSEHVSTGIFGVEIEIDIFEYSDKYNYREKAHAVFKKGRLTYECDLFDEHNYENGFYPVILKGQRYICFRKTLYGFTLLNADTLQIEFEYFPKSSAEGEESFIITETKQLDNLLIFEGCYWACPYECFAFDYDKRLFLNVSKLCGIFSLDKAVLQDNELTLYGTDENDSEKQTSLSPKDIANAMKKHGETDF